jgi:hypothetical protein
MSSNFSVAFLMREEARRQPLTEPEIRAIAIAHFFRRLWLLVFFLAPVAAGVFHLLKMQTPEWKVSAAEAEQVNLKYEKYVADADRYRRISESLQSFPPLDISVAAISGAVHPNIVLSSANFTSLGPLPGQKTPRFNLRITGQCTDNRHETYKQFMHELNERLSVSLPSGYHIKLDVKDSTVQAQGAKGLVFTLTGDITQ